MARKQIIAGNWKMNCTKQEAIELAKGIQQVTSSAQLIVFVSPIHISTVQEVLNESQIKVGAQNMYFESSGAFTGETSPSQLTSYGCNWVLIGHSERRSLFGESDSMLKQKVDAAIQHGLSPVFCIGESLEERQSGQQEEIVQDQLNDALFHLSADDFSKVVIAYEPVWAIGTGLAASPEQAQDMHHFIRDLIMQKYSFELAQDTSILYGGSMKPANAQELLAKPDIDGGLIGGASLKPDDFLAIINEIDA